METGEEKLGDSVQKRPAVTQIVDQKHHLVRKGHAAADVALHPPQTEFDFHHRFAY